MREVPRETGLPAALRSLRPNLLDRAISYFDPKAGLERYRARAMQLTAESYVGASKSRRSMAGWLTRPKSADADTLLELPELRTRSRDLERNAPIATGALSTVRTKVVGTGLALQSRVNRDLLGISEEEASAWQRRTETEFSLWAESQDCDLTRQQNFYGLQDLAFRSALVSGDVLVVMPHLLRSPGPYGLKLQVIEADRLVNKDNARDTDKLAGGVEMDGDGAPVAYHVLKQHPGAMLARPGSWDVVTAYGAQTGRRNAIHLYQRSRPGQSRGVPYLAPVIETLKQLDRYTEAEISAAVVAGLFAVFVKSEGDGLSPLESVTLGITPGSGGDSPQAGWDGKLSPGLVADLRQGEDIVSANPGRPNAAFDPFMVSILRQVGMALELPYEVLIKHFQSSYSAARAALLEAWAHFRCRRDWLATHLCQPIYEVWMEEAIALGRIVAPGFFFDPLVRFAWCQCQWVGDGPGSIDPLKEVQAARERVDLGISTLAEETMLHDGGDFELKLAQRVKEEKMRKEGGLAPSAITPGPSAPAPAAPPQQDKQATAASPSAFSGIEAAGVVAPPPLLRVDVPQPIVNVEVKPPVVNVDVQPPSITIEAPPRRRIEKIPERDKRGFITKIVETEVADDPTGS
jgi:lambda family phage portal protein